MSKGFTLIEILAATVLIVLVAIGTLSVFESGANLLIEARLKTESALLAQSEFERIIESASSTTGYYSLSSGSITVPEHFLLSKKIKEANFSVEEISAYNKKVTLNITWNMNGNEMSEEFITLVFNPAYLE